MLTRISRALLWLAALAAVVALAGPEADARWLSATAATSLLAAYGFWRVAQHDGVMAVDELVVAPGRLDESALVEIAALCRRCCADALSTVSLVDGIARLLKLELGSRWARGRVVESGAAFEPAGMAGRGAGIVIDVQLDGRQAAVIELGEPALAVAPQVLSALIEMVQTQVAEALRRLMGDGVEHATPAYAAVELRGCSPVRSPSAGGGPPLSHANALAVTSARRDATARSFSRGQCVLVVAQNQVLAEVVGELLRQQGCRFRQAPSAEEGLRELCNDVFDLVLLDIDQPDLDVQDAVGRFRRAAHGRYMGHAGRSLSLVALAPRAGAGSSPAPRGFDDQLFHPLCPNQFKAMLSRTFNALFAAATADHASQGGHRMAPTAAGRVLDEQALQRLRDLDPKGENNLLERVFMAFETSVTRLLPQLQESVRAGDRGGVRHVAHTLKSSTASIGASRLSQQCAEIESMIRLDDTTPLDSRVQAMCAEVEVVLEEVRRMMGATG